MEVDIGEIKIGIELKRIKGIKIMWTEKKRRLETQKLIWIK
jgi:hypothetical protein